MTADIAFSRTQKRAAMPLETRVVLLEQDVDEVDSYHESVNVKLDHLSGQNTQILVWLIGGALTFGVSAALLALNLATGVVR